jgi:hypothetical protein
MELPEIVHDMCEIYGRKSRELKYWLTPSMDRSEYPRRDWVKKWSALGWVLIVLGVMGEGWFEAQVSKYDSALSNITDTVVAEAQKESANAEATAKGFDARIAESDAKAKSAEATAKKFESQIAEAQRDAAESKKEAETERLERVKLEALVAPRSLSLDQQRRIADACRKFHGHGVLVKSYGTDGEGAALAEQIIAALRAADVVVADSRGTEIVAGEFDSGVHVRAPEVEHEFASTIAGALSSIGKLKVFPINDLEPRVGSGMSGGGQGFTNPGAVFVTVRVGIKPVPVLPAAK